MIRNRVRIRFCKEGDLRLISHRDLVRAMERMFRRAQLQLSMSEGFHPKARMSFPSALGLGIEGCDEIMDVELAETITEAELEQRLRAQAPPGLTLQQISCLGADHRKPRIARLRYDFPVPEDRLDATREAVEALMQQANCWIERPGRSAPLDLRGGVESLEVADGRLQMVLTFSRDGSVRPREVLAAVGLEDLEKQGEYLRRTAVELA